MSTRPNAMWSRSRAYSAVVSTSSRHVWSITLPSATRSATSPHVSLRSPTGRRMVRAATASPIPGSKGRYDKSSLTPFLRYCCVMWSVRKERPRYRGLSVQLYLSRNIQVLAAMRKGLRRLFQSLVRSGPVQNLTWWRCRHRVIVLSLGHRKPAVAANASVQEGDHLPALGDVSDQTGLTLSTYRTLNQHESLRAAETPQRPSSGSAVSDTAPPRHPPRSCGRTCSGR